MSDDFANLFGGAGEPSRPATQPKPAATSSPLDGLFDTADQPVAPAPQPVIDPVVADAARAAAKRTAEAGAVAVQKVAGVTKRASAAAQTIVDKARRIRVPRRRVLLFANAFSIVVAIAVAGTYIWSHPTTTPRPTRTSASVAPPVARLPVPAVRAPVTAPAATKPASNPKPAPQQTAPVARAPVAPPKTPAVETAPIIQVAPSRPAPQRAAAVKPQPPRTSKPAHKLGAKAKAEMQQLDNFFKSSGGH